MAKDALPPIRIDAVQFLVVGTEAVLFIMTVKTLAYRWHGNPFAQAILLTL
jgi:hypothetical protein